MRAVVPVGVELQVNIYTVAGQDRSDVGVAPDGTFVVVWESTGEDGSVAGTFARRGDGSGSLVGVEFQVNTRTTSSQYQPVVAVDGDGGFVVVWSSLGQDGAASRGIFGQRFDSLGVPLGAEFQVNSVTADHQQYPAIGMAGNGAFVVVWESNLQDGDGLGVFGQRFDASASPIGGEIQLNSFTAGDQQLVTVSRRGANVVLAWESGGQDGDGLGIVAQRLDLSSGPVGGEFQVNTQTTSNQFAPSAAVMSDGAFVVVWSSAHQALGEVFGQRYDSSGARAGGEFRVNTYTLQAQARPEVSSPGDGSFTVVWQSNTQDGDLLGVFGRDFDAAGAGGMEFQVSSYTTGDQERPAAAINGDGALVVSWQSSGQDGDQEGIFARRFLPATSTPTATITGTPTRTATPTATLTATATRTATPTASATSSATSTPSATSTASVTSTPSPTRTPTATPTATTPPGPGPTGAEFQVGTFTAGIQRLPDVAMASSGDFVVVWEDSSRDGDGFGVFGRRFASTGAALGADFQVEVFTGGSASSPAVAADAEGDFVVVWERLDGNGLGVFARLFASNGTPLTGELQFSVATVGNQRGAAVAREPGGAFVVAWQSAGRFRLRRLRPPVHFGRSRVGRRVPGERRHGRVSRESGGGDGERRVRRGVGQ